MIYDLKPMFLLFLSLYREHFCMRLSFCLIKDYLACLAFHLRHSTRYAPLVRAYPLSSTAHFAAFALGLFALCSVNVAALITRSYLACCVVNYRCLCINWFACVIQLNISSLHACCSSRGGDPQRSSLGIAVRRLHCLLRRLFYLLRHRSWSSWPIKT